MNYPDSVKLGGEFYLQVQNRLDHPDVVFSPAEIHGVATGLVCCGEDESTLANWAPILTRELEDDASRTLVEDILSGLVALTQRALRSTDFTFQMLLPPDSSEITTRTAALADWCAGFCTGTAFNSRLNEADLEPEALEALTDIARIAEVEPGTDSAEEQEKALLELEEYLRVGTQLIFEATLDSQSLQSSALETTES